MTKLSKTTFKPAESMTSSFGKPVRCQKCGAVLIWLGNGGIRNTVIDCKACKQRRLWRNLPTKSTT